jgi:cytochrome c-type biogenesis protein CcmH
MIVAGKSDKEIMEFMVQRYGDFVLYRPPVKNTTWLLWGGPFVLLAVGLALLIVRLRKMGGQAEAELSEDEHQQASRLLAKREDVS